MTIWNAGMTVGWLRLSPGFASELEDRVFTRLQPVVEHAPADEAVARLRLEIVEGGVRHGLRHVDEEAAGGELAHLPGSELAVERRHVVAAPARVADLGDDECLALRPERL